MRPVERIVRGLRSSEGIESVFVLDATGEWIAGDGIFGSAMVEDAAGSLLLLIDSAAEVMEDASLVLRYRRFQLSLSRGDDHMLGVVSTVDARRELIQLATRAASRSLDRLPPDELKAEDRHVVWESPAPTTHPAVRAAMPESSRSSAPLPRSARSRAEAPTGPPSSVPFTSSPARSSRSTTPTRPSPWARKRRRKKRGGKGIWGD